MKLKNKYTLGLMAILISISLASCAAKPVNKKHKPQWTTISSEIKNPTTINTVLNDLNVNYRSDINPWIDPVDNNPDNTHLFQRSNFSNSQYDQKLYQVSRTNNYIMRESKNTKNTLLYYVDTGGMYTMSNFIKIPGTHWKQFGPASDAKMLVTNFKTFGIEDIHNVNDFINSPLNHEVITLMKSFQKQMEPLEEAVNNSVIFGAEYEVTNDSSDDCAIDALFLIGANEFKVYYSYVSAINGYKYKNNIINNTTKHLMNNNNIIDNWRLFLNGFFNFGNYINLKIDYKNINLQTLNKEYQLNYQDKNIKHIITITSPDYGINLSKYVKKWPPSAATSLFGGSAPLDANKTEFLSHKINSKNFKK